MNLRLSAYRYCAPHRFLWGMALLLVWALVWALMWAIILGPSPAYADQPPPVGDIKVILGDYSASTDNPRSMGGRFSLLQEILSRRGLQLSTLQLPVKRFNEQLQNGSIDLIIVSDSTEVDRDILLMSDFCATFMTMGVYYKESPNWEVSWPPEQSFREASGLTSNVFYLKDEYGMNISRAASYEAGIKMVNAGRTNYFLDSVMYFENRPDALKASADGFKQRELYRLYYNFYFNDSERGRYLKKIVDEGYAELARSPEEFKQAWVADLNPNTRRAKRYDHLLELAQPMLMDNK